MTREKKLSDKRRIIVDLSWPAGSSVNAGTPKDTYDGYPYKLRLPGADDIIALIQRNGRDSYLWSVDISRAIRKLPADPLDWPLLCVHLITNTTVILA